jgi:uncharacterized repeat protein (TIGR03803 family)
MTRFTADGQRTLMHPFSSADGESLSGAPVQAANGSLFGATGEGGANSKGTIYRIDPDGTFTALHTFEATRPVNGNINSSGAAAGASLTS